MTLETVIFDLDYADYIGLPEDISGHVQSLVNRLVATAKEVSLIVLASKTKCMFARTDLVVLLLDSTPLENVTEFVYLESRISSDGNTATEVQNRIACATDNSSRLAKIWKNQGTTKNTKNRVHNACIKSACYMLRKHGVSKI